MKARLSGAYHHLWPTQGNVRAVSGARLGSAPPADMPHDPRDQGQPYEAFTGGKALDLVAYQPGAVVSRELVKK